MSQAAQGITADDFLTGLSACLVQKGVVAVSIRGESFYGAVEAAYSRLEEISDHYGVSPRFLVLLDPMHADSPAVREAISALVLRDVASLDNPEYQDLRFKINKEEASTLLSHLPGGPDLYLDITSVFLKSYTYIAM